jgi:hypothetical protein
LLEGNKAWYRTGKTNPAKFGIAVGKSIKFASDEKGNVDYKSITVLADGEVQRAPAPRNAAPVAASRDSYWEAKEARDIEKDARYQSVDIPRMTYCGAQESAIKVVELALANGGLTLPTKKGAVLDALLDAIDTVAVGLMKKRMDAPNLLADTAQAGSTPTEADSDDTPDYDDE